MLKKLISTLFIYSYSLSCHAEIGVTDSTIKLGMSNPLTGPSAQLGSQLKIGALAYFNKVNRLGGIHKRKIALYSLDDRYEPELTVLNTRKLILEDQVFALFSYVGTPTSHAIMPLLRKHKTPYLMPFTGAEFLRSEKQANIFNLRASYFEEAKVQINYLVEQKKLSKIALLIQADEFGLSVESGLRQALAEYYINPVATARFKRNSIEVKNALEQLSKHKPDAICLVGTYGPLSNFINLASYNNFFPYYTTVSFASSNDLFTKIKKPNHVLVTEVMPEPNVCNTQWCKTFKSDMKKAGVTSPNQVHLEGYVNAFLFSQASQSCGRALTRQCLLEQLHLEKERFLNLKSPFNATQINDSKVFSSFYQSSAVMPSLL